MKRQLAVMLFASLFLGLISNTLQAPVLYSSNIEHLGRLIEYVGAYAVTLVVVSISVSLMLRCAYWLMKKKRAPDIMILTWSIWVILVISAFSINIYESYVRSEMLPGIKKIISHTTANTVYQEEKNSIYVVYTKDANGHPVSSGSAVAIEKDYLATNCHVVTDGDYFVVIIRGLEKKGYLYSTHGDLCLIGVSNEKFIPVHMRPSKEVEIGEDVYTIGNPDEFEKSISKGIISNKYNKEGMIFLQTDAIIAPGSSGGGLFDHNGNLIGITTAFVPGDRIGIVIPTETIEAAILEPIVFNPIKPKIDQASVSQSSQEQETPVIQAPNTIAIPPSESNKLTRIGYYGKSQIGLMSWQGQCFIAIAGRRRPDEPTSLAIWFPHAPNGIFIFSRIINADDAIKFLSWMKSANNVQYMESKSYIFFNKTLYPLALISVSNEPQPVFIFYRDNVLTEDLLTLDDFLIQFYGYDHGPGMTTIWFGLDGLTEALAAYNKLCIKSE